MTTAVKDELPIATTSTNLQTGNNEFLIIQNDVLIIFSNDSNYLFNTLLRIIKGVAYNLPIDITTIYTHHKFDRQ